MPDLGPKPSAMRRTNDVERCAVYTGSSLYVCVRLRRVTLAAMAAMVRVSFGCSGVHWF
jgi:hypothetical protein